MIPLPTLAGVGHWIVAPIALPLAAAIALLLLSRRALAAQRLVSAVATLGALAVAVALLVAVRDGGHVVYRVGDWPSPVAIVLVLDRLSALMLLLTAVVAAGSLAYACLGADRRGRYFHPLFQLQLMGLHGAFLTGDLFNLFVFFEVLLIASYCLLLHGGGVARLKAGVHYVVINLSGSALFLIAVGVLYAVTGALNMADLSVRVAALPPGDAALVRSAGLLLLGVFALKAAVAPLYFWLPGAYSAASAPVAALFALMTKVGVYAIVRVYPLVFGAEAGVGTALIEPWLLPAALATQCLGVVGALASRELRRMQGYLLIASVGVMLAGVGIFTTEGVGAALYYMVHSTLVTAAMFLLADLVAQQRGHVGTALRPAVAVRQPALLATLFFVGSIGVVGLPPLSGFVGKALVLAAAPSTPAGWWLWGITLGASVLMLLACMRAGTLIFWSVERAPEAPAAPAAPARAANRWRPVPVVALLGALALLAAAAGPVSAYTRATAGDLLAPGDYVRSVLSAP